MDVNGSLASPGNRATRHARAGAAIFALHVAVAALYKELAGVSLDPGPDFTWDASWHLMPLDLLKSHLVATLGDLHAQPPFYNLWCGIFVKLFAPNHIVAMHYPSIILGGLIAAMVYGLLRRLVSNQKAAFFIAALLALNPALFLFEANLGYDLITAFWATLAVYGTARFYDGRQDAWLWVGILALNLLILTRSMYHPALLSVFIPLACIAAGKRWRRTLAVALILSLLPLGWCVKNATRFGFFGTSSWAGQNWWTHVSANYDRADLTGFIDAGFIDAVVLDVLVWNRPDAYESYGFNKRSPRSALSRNNYNNLNIVDISRLYGRNAARLVYHQPFHYLVNVAKAFRIYCTPTSRTKFVQANAGKMGFHEAFVSQIVQGQYFTGLLARFVRKDPFLSFWFFVLPGSLIALAVKAWRRCGWSREAWLEYARGDGLLPALALLILYTTVVACLFDYGENGRFRFAIEPILWPFVIGVLCARRSRTP
ncbi:MAG TPA: glycosyltransferase family 39 protein [Candidatus Hydrogenedentes bacterium]|nr:glycosyltransferase family 39 protein [Candidatus Hydrogenedentota bacterium]